MSDDIYQEIILEHFRNPRNFGEMEEFTCRGQAANTVCGDEVEVFLAVREGVVEDVRAKAAGCAICKASASLMTEGIKGLSTEFAESLLARVRQLIDGPGEPPEVEGELLALAQLREYPMRRFCGLVAWKALENALRSICATIADS